MQVKTTTDGFFAQEHDSVLAEVKGRAQQYAQGLITTHELCVSIKDLTGYEVQVVQPTYISLVMTHKTPLVELVTSVTIDL